MKNDIRNYSDSELSLLCFNDEPLYKAVTSRRATHESITALVSELFEYTPEQLAELLSDCDEDRKENA